MPTATKAKAVAADAPALIDLPTRALYLPRPLAGLLFAAGLTSFAITFLRPEKVPPKVQYGADAFSAIIATHPAEVLVYRRWAKKRVTRGTRRRLTVSTTVFGITSFAPAYWNYRKARKAARATL